MIYELRDTDALTSPEYLERLNNPTPWTKQVMAMALSLNRTLCRVVGSHSVGIGAHLLTMRVEQLDGSDSDHHWPSSRSAERGDELTTPHTSLPKGSDRLAHSAIAARSGCRTIQTPNRCGIHAVGPRNISLRLTITHSSDSFLAGER